MTDGEGIVISGFSGRFPSSESISEFEHNLYHSVDMVTADDSRWPVGLWKLSSRNGKIASFDRFDNEFFGIPIQDVEFIDPQERLLLEVAIEAITDSGVSPFSLRGSHTGCFIGNCFKEIHDNVDSGNVEKIPSVPASVPTRLSKFLGLTGPICYIDTACGSSLSALHEAFTCMRSGLCDQAIVAGVNSLFRARISIAFRDLGMINVDGKCKCLSSDADGYCRSESIAALFLQKSKDASRIYATILNSISNSDGFKEEGITFPSRTSQKVLIQETLKGANVDPFEVNYIEAHCTGTQAGDPVELNAIHDALCNVAGGDSDQKQRNEPLLIGCLKSNIGHTEGASGLSAIAKSLLVLENKSIPPNLHFKEPNPNIVGLQDGSIVGVNSITPFPCPNNPLVGVNCFGFGGANTHVIMKGNTITKERNETKNISGNNKRLVLISGRTKFEISAVLNYLSGNNTPFSNCGKNLVLKNGIQPGFLHLLDRLATDNSDLKFRSSILVESNHEQNCYTVDEHAVADCIKNTIEADLNHDYGLIVNLCSFYPIFEIIKSRNGHKVNLRNEVSQLWTQFNEQFIRYLPMKFFQDYFIPWMKEWNQISGRAYFTDLPITNQDYILKCSNEQDIMMALFIMNATILQFLSQELGIKLDQIKCDNTCKESKLIVQLLKTIINEKNQKKYRIQVLEVVSMLLAKNYSEMNSSYHDRWSLLDDILVKASDNHETLMAEGMNQNRHCLEVSIGKAAEELFSVERGSKDGMQKMNLLNLISLLHTTNAVQSIKMTNLYKYEGSVPVGTAMINSLIKWNHDRKFDLNVFCSQWLRYQTQFSANVVFNFDRSTPEHEYLFDHIIDGRILFPATGYLMMVWSAFTKRADYTVMPIFDNPVKFYDVQFMRASVMDSESRIYFVVKINFDSGLFVILEGDNKDPIVTGTVTRANYNQEYFLKNIDDQQSNSNAKSIKLRPKDIYKELRVRGYDYGLMFQGIHNLELNSDTLKISDAQLIWRHVVKKSLRPVTVGNSESMVQLWTKNWIPFADSLLQVSIIESDFNRGLFVPTYLESLTCFPQQLNQYVMNAERINDAVSGDVGSIVPVTLDHDTSTLSVPGLYVKGLKTSPVPRRNQTASIKAYQFDTFFNPEVLLYHDTLKGVKELKNEIDEYWTQLENNFGNYALNGAITLTSDKFYDSNRYSMLHFNSNDAVYDENGNKIEFEKVSVKGDLLLGNYSGIWTVIESPLLELQLDTVITSVVDCDLVNVAQDDINHVTELSVLELVPFDLYQGLKENFLLYESLLKIFDDSMFYDKISAKCTISSLCNIKNNMTDNGIMFSDSRISVKKLKASKVPEKNLVVVNLLNIDSGKGFQVEHYLVNIQNQAKDFILVLCKDMSIFPEHFPTIETMDLEIRNVIEELTSTSEFKLISSRSLSAKHPLRALLFKRIKSDLKPEDQIIIDIELKNEAIWIPKLQDAIKSINDSENKISKRIWIRNSCSESISGVHGLVKTLRLEHPMMIRGIVDLSSYQEEYGIVKRNNGKMFKDLKYEHVLRNDLVMNVKLDDNQGWGSYVHFPLPEKAIDDKNLSVATSQSILKMSKPGDLTSFFWTSSESFENMKSSNKFEVKVIYAPLNFRDIMYATGGLSPPSSSALGSTELPFGLEFSGIEVKTGDRLMGFVPKRALSSKVFAERDFVWNVPDDWTLEEAGSVPIVYATAYYALMVRGKMTNYDRVLIHSAAGGVGLASLNICIKRGIKRENLFITVGSEEKKRFLLDKFGLKNILPENIFSSRNSDFEYQILSTTNGRGLDIILNSLAGHLLRASLSILAPYGRFLEIGKVDFFNNSIMDTIHDLGDNKSFHGIILDSLFCDQNLDHYSSNLRKERLELRTLMENGLMSGEVSPISPRTVFDREDVERAFRFMTRGQHVGKIMLKLGDDPKSASESKSNTMFEKKIAVKNGAHFDPEKVVIVVGGLGGLGLELVNWIVTVKGVRKLILVSRTGIKNDYQEFCIKRIEKLGAKVFVTTNYDCCTEEGGDGLMRESTAWFPNSKIGSIFSIATVYKDLSFMDQNENLFNTVMKPKAHVTVNLDKVSRDMNLDHFVCFSSASCGRGNPGQSSYNLANSIMENICKERTKVGVSGVSIAIQWGVIGDVGVVAETMSGQDVVLLGSRSQRIPSIFGTLDRILASAEVTKKLWTVCDFIKAGTILIGTKKDGSGQHLTQSICHIMGINDIRSIDGSVSLGSLGIDSLIAIEIKQTLERCSNAVFSLKQIRDLTLNQLVKLSESVGGNVNSS